MIHAQTHDQRPLELHVDLEIDQPANFPSLDDAFYRPLATEQEESAKLDQNPEQDQEDEPPHEPTDEELLEPVVLSAIEKKLQEAQEELERRLEERKVEMEEKIQNIALAQKKGGKK